METLSIKAGAHGALTGAVGRYLAERYGQAARLRGMRPLGTGAHGTGWLIEADAPSGRVELVLKSVAPAGLGHDYPADRAAMQILARDTFNHDIPGHVEAVDVLALTPHGDLMRVPHAGEYYLVMERGHGHDYFGDVEAMSMRSHMGELDAGRVRALAELMAAIHARKPGPADAVDATSLWRRRLRDVVGHGECLMGVFDTYPPGVVPEDELTEIERLAVGWRWRLRGLAHRLCRVHGDFHPGNVLFSEPTLERDVGRVTLLDRSRGPWGEAADDVSALTINYIFYSVLARGQLDGACREALEIFFDEYVSLTGDRGIFGVLAPFYAFRAAVVANPVFYPDVEPYYRRLLLRFATGVLESESFHPRAVNLYLK
jgi:hypothetical protein